MDSDKELLKYIKNRTKAENKLASLESILKLSRMETYFMICGNRIADAMLIDCENVQLNFLNLPDLLFDSKGILQCFDILNGYVDKDRLFEIYECARINDQITDDMNAFLDTLRGFKVGKLLKLWIRESMKPHDEYSNRISKMSRAELISRTPFNKARIWIKKRSMQLYVNIRYRNIFSALKKCANDNAQMTL